MPNPTFQTACGLLGFQPNLPVVSLFPTLHYMFGLAAKCRIRESDLQRLRAITGRLGCQTQRFRRPVGLLGFQPKLPVVSLFPAFHYTTIAVQTRKPSLYHHCMICRGRLKGFRRPRFCLPAKRLICAAQATTRLPKITISASCVSKSHTRGRRPHSWKPSV